MTSSGKPVTILKRSAHYVTYTDGHDSRKVIVRKDLFGGCEYILVPSGYPGMNYFCVASDVIGLA